MTDEKTEKRKQKSPVEERKGSYRRTCGLFIRADVKIGTMKKNDEFELECTDLSDQGFGIGHHDGMTIFVSDLLPDEKARIRIIKVQKTYAIGKVIERIHTSSDRTEPVCAKAGKCGGCALLHLRYDKQLDYKEKQLKDLFSKVDPQIEVLPPLGMETPYYYRNKAQFPIGVQGGKVVGGFYRARTNEIVPVDECRIQSKEINAIYKWVLDHLSVRQAQNLRHLFIRYSDQTDQAQVVFIGAKNMDLEDLTRKMVAAFPKITSVVFNENKRSDNVILDEPYTVLYGSDSLDVKCLDLDIRLHFKSFFQVNPAQMAVLYATALELADLKKTDEVIELYSGTGTIGLLAARKAGHVTGVEIVPEAVENARENQKRNHIENAEFICMDATQFAHQNTKSADVVLVDPPRKGMTSQGIEDIAALNPQRVVYISCNPRTLARDLGEFKKKGYRAARIQPVDMFPNTTGMECAALIVKEDFQSQKKK